MPDNLKRLAKRAINIVEQKLKDDFGLTIKMGAELEFTVVATDEMTVLGYKEGNLLDVSVLDRSRDYRPSKLKESKSKFFPDSPYISTFYKENGQNKYEIVFSHEVEHESQVVLARAIESTKSTIIKNASEYGIEEVIFNSKNTAHGLHINVSIVNEDGKNVLGDGHALQQTSYYNVSTYMSNSILQTLNEAILIMSPEEDSYNRFLYYNFAPKYVATTDAIIRGENRLEVRLASADADPYSAIAAVMVGLYYGLSNEKEIKIENGEAELVKFKHTPLNLGAIPRSKEIAVEQFENGTIIKNILNELSENDLGTQFHKAVLENARSNETSQQKTR